MVGYCQYGVVLEQTVLGGRRQDSKRQARAGEDRDSVSGGGKTGAKAAKTGKAVSW